MRAIIVDDEPLPLQHLTDLLKTKFDDIEVIGAYTDPIEAEKMIKQHRPTLIFLDIEMPEINGLQLGERIQETCPEIEIIFVTAFDKYAIQAFKLYAIDYIMKPIRLERLQSTIDQIKFRMKSHIEQARPVVKKSVSCFNTISVIHNQQKTEEIKWRTKKAQELFAYMLHHRGTIVYRDTILELLWPNFDTSKAIKQLYTTFYHIRKTLETYELSDISINPVQLVNGYRLEINKVQIDTDEWAKQVIAIRAIDDETIEYAEQLLRSYKGRYLGELDYIWAIGESERLKQLLLNFVKQLQNYYLTKSEIDKAIEVNNYVKQCEPTEEVSYFNLMKLYAILKNTVAVHDHYTQLKTLLRHEQDSLPDEDITKWYNQWKREKINL